MVRFVMVSRRIRRRPAGRGPERHTFWQPLPNRQQRESLALRYFSPERIRLLQYFIEINYSFVALKGVFIEFDYRFEHSFCYILERPVGFIYFFWIHSNIRRWKRDLMCELKFSARCVQTLNSLDEQIFVGIRGFGLQTRQLLQQCFFHDFNYFYVNNFNGLTKIHQSIYTRNFSV